LVKKYVYVKSKKLRNQIAGYLTHLVKIRMKRMGQQATSFSE
ncbi:MAG: 30S ribosomal protein S17e, partial [Desulfurococcales archaeon]|nr:30S ribosomal protein S17e [Desulfurococcales archaeon]